MELVIVILAVPLRIKLSGLIALERVEQHLKKNHSQTTEKTCFKEHITLLKSNDKMMGQKWTTLIQMDQHHWIHQHSRCVDADMRGLMRGPRQQVV